MFSRPWLTLLRRHVLIHRRALAFCLTVAAVLVGWSAFLARPPVGEAACPAPVVPSAAAAVRPGYVRLPVRFADGETAALLHPGARIQLWATDPRSSRTRLVAARAAVFDVPTPAANGVMSARSSRLVVVEVPAADVEKVTTSGANWVLSYALDQ